MRIIATKATPPARAPRIASSRVVSLRRSGAGAGAGVEVEVGVLGGELSDVTALGTVIGVVEAVLVGSSVLGMAEEDWP
jgi:hypothetical protein